MVTMTTDSLKIFLYGSFMDIEVLRTLGVVPRTFETAELKNWTITFSPMATLVRSEEDSVYGIIAELSRTEVRTLYSRDDLKHYKPVEITVETERNKRVPAQCYISKPGTGQKPSVEYLRRVIHAAENLDFPPAYLAQLRRTPTSPTSNSERRLQLRDGRIFFHAEDLESAKKFYLDILGIQLDRDGSEWIDLKPALGLSVSTGRERLIEFHVDNFEEAADILEKNGIQVTRDTKHQGAVKDPSGNIIGLHDHPK